MTSLQDLYRIGYDLDSLIRGIVASSRGMIKTVIVVSRDLYVLTLEVGCNISLDDLTSASAVIISAFSNILREAGLSSSEKIRIQLDDKRYLIIQSHIDYFLICIAKSNVRLGFIDLVLEGTVNQVIRIPLSWFL
ncbi:MAG: hypothetical protein QW128_03950 [Thermoprotei archaeon]